METNTANIRQYLTSTYSDEELSTFCFDHFRAVYDSFGAGRTRGQKIQDLIEYCDHHDLVSDLLAALEQDRPDQYRKWFGQALVKSGRKPRRTPLPAPKFAGIVIAIVIVCVVLVFGTRFLVASLTDRTSTPTSTLTHTPSPSPTSSFTPTSAPTPTALVVDSMDGREGWIPFSDPRSVITPSVVPGLYNTAIQLDFNLQPNVLIYVGIGKAITPTLLTGTQAMRFYYRGTGRNTIELKLLYNPALGGEVFTYSRLENADTDDWLLFEQRYEAFDCGTSCKTAGQKVDPARVRKVEIVISHQLGGTSGPGWIALDQIEAIRSTTPPPACASCVGCVTGRGYGCPGNMKAVMEGKNDRYCAETFDLPSPALTNQIRIEMTIKGWEEFGYSLYEVEAYGPDDAGRNLLKSGEATALSIEDGRYLANNAIDGDMLSRWASAQDQDPQWLEITLPRPALVDRIVLKWERAYAAEYCVIVKPAP